MMGTAEFAVHASTVLLVDLDQLVSNLQVIVTWHWTLEAYLLQLNLIPRANRRHRTAVSLAVMVVVRDSDPLNRW